MKAVIIVSSTPAGLSVWETELLEHLTQHSANEEKFLVSYQRVADQSQSPYVSYLMKLIAEEETRHHRMFDELANALRAPVEREVGATVPVVLGVANPRELLEAAEALLEAERNDARALKRLSRKLRSMRGVSLWPLLVELMERDTDKHQAILRFVRTRLRAQVRSRP